MNDALTIIVLSCKRLPYLGRTMAAARHHFESIERLDVRWVCFDNGSSAADQQAVAEMGFDLFLASRTNLGQGPALNQLIAAVRTEFFLLLEDDWVLENPGGIPFVSECMCILERDPNLGQVKLDAMHFLDFGDRAMYDGPFSATPGRRYFVQNPRTQWGGFCCPPAISRTAALREVGPFREDRPFQRWWAESEYCVRFARRFFVAKSPDMLLFRHIGDEPSPGWGASGSAERPMEGAVAR